MSPEAQKFFCLLSQARIRLQRLWKECCVIPPGKKKK